MSVQTTNLISKVILGAAMESGAVAGAAAWMVSPIGPIGGAIFGAVRHLSQLPLAHFGKYYLNTDNPLATSAAKTLSAVIQFFGSYATAWAALYAAGFVLTLSHMVTLSVASIFTMIAIHFAIGCLGLNPEAARIAR